MTKRQLKKQERLARRQARNDMAMKTLLHIRHSILPGTAVKKAVISYADFCEKMGLTRAHCQIVRKYLASVATRCKELGWPPINALVVRAGDAGRGPGSGYGKVTDGNWPLHIQQVLAFDYPLDA